MKRWVRGLVAAGLNASLLAIPLIVTLRAFAEPAVVLFVALTSIFAGLEAAGQVGPDRGGSRLELATGVVLLALFWTALVTRGGCSSPVWMGGGAALAIWGISLRWRAMRALGPAFVSEVRAAPARSLVMSGVYAQRRHPSEAGMLAIALGATLILRSAASTLVWSTVLVPLVLMRVRREDALLHQTYGPAYARYAAMVKRLW